jgi:mRNA interferase MazF
MPTFESGDIVRVPFPYVDRNVTHHRPAMVVASDLGLTGMLTWVLMVTAAENRRWPGDIAIADHLASGLPIPSIVRTSKLVTVLTRRAQKLGRLSRGNLAAVEAELASHLRITSAHGGFNE